MALYRPWRSYLHGCTSTYLSPALLTLLMNFGFAQPLSCVCAHRADWRPCLPEASPSSCAAAVPREKVTWSFISVCRSGAQCAGEISWWTKKRQRPVRLAEFWLKLAEKHCFYWIVVRKKHYSVWKKEVEQAEYKVSQTGPDMCWRRWET